MKTEIKEEITRLLIVAGYEEQLNEIVFIEDEEPKEVDLIDYDLEPIEFEELY